MRLGDGVKKAADRESDKTKQGHQEHRGQESGPRPCRNEKDQRDCCHHSTNAKAGGSFEALVHRREDAGSEPVDHGDRRSDEPEGPAGYADEAVVLAVDRGKISGDRIDEQSADQHNRDALSRERVSCGANRELERRSTATLRMIARLCGFLKAQRDPQTTERLQQHERDGKTSGNIDVDMQSIGREAVPPRGIVQQRAKGHRDEKSGRAPAHGGGHDLIPCRLAIFFRQGFVNDCFVRTTGGCFGSAREKTVEQAKREQKHAAVFGRKEQHTHFQHHQACGKHQQAFAAERIGQRAGWHFEKKDRRSPHGIEQQVLLEAQPKVGEKHREHRVVGPRVVKSCEEDKEPRVPPLERSAAIKEGVHSAGFSRNRRAGKMMLVQCACGD